MLKKLPMCMAGLTTMGMPLGLQQFRQISITLGLKFQFYKSSLLYPCNFWQLVISIKKLMKDKKLEN